MIGKTRKKTSLFEQLSVLLAGAENTGWRGSFSVEWNGC
jgi:hypothetical protein